MTLSLVLPPQSFTDCKNISIVCIYWTTWFFFVCFQASSRWSCSSTDKQIHCWLDVGSQEFPLTHSSSEHTVFHSECVYFGWCGTLPALVVNVGLGNTVPCHMSVWLGTFFFWMPQSDLYDDPWRRASLLKTWDWISGDESRVFV
jgi:hypothetical protein